MEKIKIPIDNSTFRITSSGLVTGEVWVAVSEKEFPEARWNDFVLPILSWWCEGFLELKSHKDDGVEFTFMDGPYTFYISKADNKLDIDCFRNLSYEPVENKLFWSEKTSSTANQFGSELLKACKIVLDFCERSGLKNSDTEDLKIFCINLNAIL